MSTKTTIKRIALVAAVAAAFGGLSTVAANATSNGAAYPTVTAATWSVTQATSGTSTGAATSNPTTVQGTTVSTAGTQVVGGVATAYFVETATAGAATDYENFANITSTGVGSIISVGTGLSASTGHIAAPTATVTGTTTSTQVTYPTTSLSVLANAATQDSTAIAFPVSVTSSVAGTQTLTATVIGANGAPSGSYTATITWGAAPVVSAQYSTAYIHAGNAYNGTAAQNASDTAAITGTSTYTANMNPIADVLVTLKSSSTATITGQGLTATITGAGTLGISNSTSVPSAPTGSSISVAASGSGATYDVAIYPNGLAGAGTLTLVSGTTTIGTFTVTFTGTAKKVTAVQNLKVLKAGGKEVGDLTVADTTKAGYYYNGAYDAADAATVLATGGINSATVQGTPVITAYTYDSSGNPVVINAADATVIKVAVSDTSVLTAGTCVNVTSGASLSSTAVNNQINCYVLGTVGAASGKSATATVELWDSTTSAWDYTATPLTFTIGGAITKEVLATDSASYAPGQPVKLTVTATDASGNPAYDQDQTLVGTITSSSYMPSLKSPSYILGGTVTATVGYAPAADGSFTISGTDATAAAAANSVTASVTSGAATQASSATDAANEATDAANAATDAANAAADAADAATAAAQDAGAKADAALAAVTALSAKITVLAAQIAKIVKKLGA